VDLLRPAGGAPGLAPALLLFGGTLGGVLVAGLLAWRLLAPIGSLYRRGALAVVSGFATILFMLVSIPIHQTMGRPGLAGLAAALAGASALCALGARGGVRAP
jgi:hypothetical protein